MNRARVFLFFIFICIQLIASAQNNAFIKGRITDTENKGISWANIAVSDSKIGTSTSFNGTFRLEVPSDKKITLIISCIGYATEYIIVTAKPGETIEINKSLSVSTEQIEEVAITARQEMSGTLQRLEVKSIGMLPTASGNLESLLKTLPGVSSNNEMSSQYSVRGGSYDENLVYINDVEVYRPMLIRSGQQEGLSIINPDLVGNVRFSAGGFESAYGDKLSSVLDITYRKPVRTAASFSASFLGGSVHAEGISKNKKFTFLTGARYKTSKYLLNSLETKGEYQPKFIDFQTLLAYQLTQRSELSVMGIISQNNYLFVPENRETRFGTYTNMKRFTIYYDGNEMDKYTSLTGAATYTYKPINNLQLKLIGSAFTTEETEQFDILGQYSISNLDDTQNPENPLDSIEDRGVGSYLSHARNEFKAQVYQFGHKGEYKQGSHRTRWGISGQYEQIQDVLNEWEMLDSIGYYSISSVRKGRNNLSPIRIQAYLQHTSEFRIDSARLFITAGLRGHRWSFNNELLISPRVSISLKPAWENDVLFYVATGFYHQPVFYREMRSDSGKLNNQIRAQKSYQVLIGSDYSFQLWERPFKFTSELYYKHLWDLIPYKVDNVRISYLGRNNATGYTTGIDLKLNGAFVKGTDSWLSLSMLRSYENQNDDFYYDKNGQQQFPGYYPRPSDQLLNIGLYFEDYLPRNPSWKVHLTAMYGSRLPFTEPYTKRYDIAFRMPPYRRVDIGFSKLLKSEEEVISNKSNPLSWFRTLWISAEVFNLLNINNTNSYMWIKTISNNNDFAGYYAVPNYLTGRRINLKLTASF